MNQVFIVGEEVVALNDPPNNLSQPRAKGKLYKVLAVSYCVRCGKQAINISGHISLNIGPNTSCGDYNCGSIQHHQGLWWTMSYHFVRPEDIYEAIEEFVSKEDYEACQVLKKFEEDNLIKIKQ